MVEMGDVELEIGVEFLWAVTELVEDVKKAQRVGPTRDGNDDGTSGGQEVVMFDVGCDGV